MSNDRLPEPLFALLDRIDSLTPEAPLSKTPTDKPLPPPATATIKLDAEDAERFLALQSQLPETWRVVPCQNRETKLITYHFKHDGMDVMFLKVRGIMWNENGGAWYPTELRWLRTHTEKLHEETCPSCGKLYYSKLKLPKRAET